MRNQTLVVNRSLHDPFNNGTRTKKNRHTRSRKHLQRSKRVVALTNNGSVVSSRVPGKRMTVPDGHVLDREVNGSHEQRREAASLTSLRKCVCSFKSNSTQHYTTLASASHINFIAIVYLDLKNRIF